MLRHSCLSLQSYESLSRVSIGRLNFVFKIRKLLETFSVEDRDNSMTINNLEHNTTYGMAVMYCLLDVKLFTLIGNLLDKITVKNL